MMRYLERCTDDVQFVASVANSVVPSESFASLRVGLA
jgi:hypothetical protein